MNRAIITTGLQRIQKSRPALPKRPATPKKAAIANRAAQVFGLVRNGSPWRSASVCGPTPTTAQPERGASRVHSLYRDRGVDADDFQPHGPVLQREARLHVLDIAVFQQVRKVQP